MLYPFSSLILCHSLHVSALAERNPEPMAKPDNSDSVENLHQREAQEDMRVGAGEIDQEAEATVADNIESEEISWLRHFIAQTPDDEKEDDIENELIKGGRLATYSILHKIGRASCRERG